MSKVIASGLSRATGENEIQSFFSNFGKVLSIEFRNRNERCSDRAIIEFESEEVAEQVCKIRKHYISDKKVCNSEKSHFSVFLGWLQALSWGSKACDAARTYRNRLRPFWPKTKIRKHAGKDRVPSKIFSVLEPLGTECWWSYKKLSKSNAERTAQMKAAQKHKEENKALKVGC